MTPECYDDGQVLELGVKGWEDKSNTTFGTMRHAFPRCVIVDVSFKRDLADRQYCVYISDGDLGMCCQLGSGMGDGCMSVNRNGEDTPILGCSFHKIQSVIKMMNFFIIAARLERVRERQSGRLTNSRRQADNYLDCEASAQTIFGSLLDECMNTDSAAIGNACWLMIVHKANMIGLFEMMYKLTHYHHPRTGQQGMWGRWNQLQEMEEGINEPRLMYGVSNTSNGIEGRMNKALKRATGMSLPFGALCTAAQNCLTSLTRTMATDVGFSVVPDQLGHCTETLHNKSSGSYGAEKTGNVVYIIMCLFSYETSV